MDGVVVSVALIIAVLSGLLLFWINNPTWGSCSDILVTFLWGAGVHQLSNATAWNVNGVLNRLSL